MTAVSAAAPGLDGESLALLAGVPQALDDGLRILDWWKRAEAAGTFAQRFPLVRESRPPDASFGFFDSVDLASGPTPVMGVFQEMFFDRARGAPPESMRDQLREFVLRYFMRVSDFQEPVAFVPERSAPYLPGVSWCPQETDGRRGFGYNQIYYRRSGGEVGRFPSDERADIVDLRELGTLWDWIVVDVDIFDFNLDLAPFGERYPYLRVPALEQTLVVLAPAFVRYEDDPEPGVLGRYGLGYALLRDPRTEVLAYGPGQFSAGFQTIDFTITADGVARACLVFVVNRPEQILNLSYNPLAWGAELASLAAGLFAPDLSRLFQRLAPPLPPHGFDPVFTFITLANLASGGRAAADLCISRESLERQMLSQHFIEHFNLIEGAMATWRRAPSWLDSGSMPEWVPGRPR